MSPLSTRTQREVTNNSVEMLFARLKAVNEAIAAAENSIADLEHEYAFLVAQLKTNDVPADPREIEDMTLPTTGPDVTPVVTAIIMRLSEIVDEIQDIQTELRNLHSIRNYLMQQIEAAVEVGANG